MKTQDFHVGLSHCTTPFATSAEVQPNFTFKQDAKQAMKEHRSFLLYRETGSAECGCGTLRETHTSEGRDAGPWLRPRQRLPSRNNTRSPGHRDGTSGTDGRGGEPKGRGGGEGSPGMGLRNSLRRPQRNTSGSGKGPGRPNRPRGREEAPRPGRAQAHHEAPLGPGQSGPESCKRAAPGNIRGQDTGKGWE